MVKIDNLNDLAEQDHMKIVVRYDDSFVEFVNMKDTPLKKRLSAQLMAYDVLHDIVQDMMRGLRNGSLAALNKRNMGIFNMLILSDYETRPENEPRLIDLLYFSEKTDYYEPYFMLYNKGGPHWFTHNLNTMYIF